MAILASAMKKADEFVKENRKAFYLYKEVSDSLINQIGDHKENDDKYITLSDGVVYKYYGKTEQGQFIFIKKSDEINICKNILLSKNDMYEIVRVYTYNNFGYKETFDKLRYDPTVEKSNQWKEFFIKLDQKEAIKKEEEKPHSQQKEEIRPYIPSKKIEEEKEIKQEKYLTNIQPMQQNHGIKSPQITKDHISNWMGGVVGRAENRSKNANEPVELNPYYYHHNTIYYNNKPEHELTYLEQQKRIRDIMARSKLERDNKEVKDPKKDNENSMEEIQLQKAINNKIEKPIYVSEKEDQSSSLHPYGFKEAYKKREENSSANLGSKTKNESLQEERPGTWFDNLKRCCCPCIRFN